MILQQVLINFFLSHAEKTKKTVFVFILRHIDPQSKLSSSSDVEAQAIII